MFKHIISVIIPFLVLCSCVQGDYDTINNICGQEPCYEGPFEPPWISGYDLGLVIYDMQGKKMTYDNRVLETENFLILSDASEDWAKIKMGKTAETALKMIKNLFDISNEDLGILDGDRMSKLRVYSAREDTGQYGPWAFDNGFVMWAYDSYTFSKLEWIPDTVEHECTHVVQNKLAGTFAKIGAWFREGLAEYISDGGPYKVIKCWQEVDEWRQDPGHVNPITIASLTDIPDYTSMDAQRREEYYPVFGLAVSYLVSPEGHGRTLIDVKEMFADIGRGMDFFNAFETRMGMSLMYYEENFYTSIKNFLPERCEEEKQ